jgi:hypothetical protein
MKIGVHFTVSCPKQKLIKNKAPSKKRRGLEVRFIIAIFCEEEFIYRLTFRLTDGGALLFRPPTTAADFFTNAKVNYKCSIFNVLLKLPPSIAFSRLLQRPAPLLVNRC